VTHNQQTVPCEVLTGRGQNIQERSGHSDTEQTYGTVWITERLWTDTTV